MKGAIHTFSPDEEAAFVRNPSSFSARRDTLRPFTSAPVAAPATTRPAPPPKRCYQCGVTLDNPRRLRCVACTEQAAQAVEDARTKRRETREQRRTEQAAVRDRRRRETVEARALRQRIKDATPRPDRTVRTCDDCGRLVAVGPRCQRCARKARPRAPTTVIIGRRPVVDAPAPPPVALRRFEHFDAAGCMVPGCMAPVGLNGRYCIDHLIDVTRVVEVAADV